jgi:hypothetical protein
MELDEELDLEALLRSLLQCRQDPFNAVKKDYLGGLGSCPNWVYYEFICLVVEEMLGYDWCKWRAYKVLIRKAVKCAVAIRREIWKILLLLIGWNPLL